MQYSDAGIQLKSIIDTAVDGIIIINNIGIIEEINPSACKLFDYTDIEVIGKNVSFLMPTEHSRNHDKYIHEYKTTRQPKIIGIGREVNGKKKTGEIFPFWLAVSEIKLKDRTIFSGFIHDLTQIKSAEKNLKVLNEELERKVVERTYEMEKIVNRLLALNNEYEIEIKHRIEVQNQLKEREMALEKSLKKEKELGELKSRFVSMASHEFRTPLSTILSSVSLIGRYTETEQQDNRDKHINKIKTSVSHMTDILNDFLSVNKLEEGKVNASNENFDIILLGKSIIDELKSIAPQGLEFRFISTKENLEIFSDKKIVKNIMINLIANAIKYSKSTGFVECEIKKEGSNLLFSVTDDGIGIPDEEQKHLFDRFFRASNAINIEGTGLGLNIVKKYLDMLKGNISFTSKLYKGTRFQVRLPLNLK